MASSFCPEVHHLIPFNGNFRPELDWGPGWESKNCSESPETHSVLNFLKSNNFWFTFGGHFGQFY